jgi:hypothetical protein
LPRQLWYKHEEWDRDNIIAISAYYESIRNTYIVYHVASIKGKFMEEKMKEYLTFLLHFNCFEDWIMNIYRTFKMNLKIFDWWPPKLKVIYEFFFSWYLWAAII